MNSPSKRGGIVLKNQDIINRYATTLRPDKSEPPILTDATRGALMMWIREMESVNELAEVNLTPRKTALFSGPPGCGKTTMAHHIAARKGIPLVLVDMASLRSRYVGASGEQISELFSACREDAEKLVLFLDEFDAMGSARGDTHQAAGKEANAIVVALLQHIDMWPGMLIAATNMGTNIDPALWRRFGVNITIGLPEEEQRFSILRRYTLPFNLDDDLIWSLSAQTAGATPALLKQLGEGIKRELAMAARLNLSKDFQPLLSRVIASCRPHEDLPQPPLWLTGRFDQLATNFSWPPALERTQPESEGKHA